MIIHRFKYEINRVWKAAQLINIIYFCVNLVTQKQQASLILSQDNLANLTSVATSTAPGIPGGQAVMAQIVQPGGWGPTALKLQGE